jgi:hypothetical protein
MTVESPPYPDGLGSRSASAVGPTSQPMEPDALRRVSTSCIEDPAEGDALLLNVSTVSEAEGLPRGPLRHVRQFVETESFSRRVVFEVGRQSCLTHIFARVLTLSHCAVTCDPRPPRNFDPLALVDPRLAGQGGIRGRVLQN